MCVNYISMMSVLLKFTFHVVIVIVDVEFVMVAVVVI